MIGHTSLWEVVGTDLLGTISCTDLASTHFCFGIVTLLLFHIVQLRFQDGKSLCLILDLGFLGLAVNHNTGRIMGQTNRRVCRIHTLAPITGRTHHVNTDILILNHNINIVFHLRHYCY